VITSTVIQKKIATEWDKIIYHFAEAINTGIVLKL